jgi:hypothetical protein
MMMMSENVRQGTSEKKQVGCSGECVAGMRDEQVDAERRRHNRYSQTKS